MKWRIWFAATQRKGWSIPWHKIYASPLENGTTPSLHRFLSIIFMKRSPTWLRTNPHPARRLATLVFEDCPRFVLSLRFIDYDYYLLAKPLAAANR